MVGVFHDVARRVRPARAQVHRVHGGRARLFAPIDELVQAEFVALRGGPSQIQAPGAPLLGADGILPLEAGNEVPARIAHHGHADLAHQRQHILPEPLRVCPGMAGFVNAAVHAAAQMFNERTVYPWIDPADLIIAIENQRSLFHGRALLFSGFAFIIGHSRPKVNRQTRKF